MGAGRDSQALQSVHVDLSKLRGSESRCENGDAKLLICDGHCCIPTTVTQGHPFSGRPASPPPRRPELSGRSRAGEHRREQTGPEQGGTRGCGGGGVVVVVAVAVAAEEPPLIMACGGHWLSVEEALLLIERLLNVPCVWGGKSGGQKGKFLRLLGLEP